MMISSGLKEFSANWYVVQTHSKQEDRAAGNLEAWNVKTLNPKIKQRRVNPYTGTISNIVKPLFPRYIFARFDADKMLHKICYTRGVQNVVCFGGNPALVENGMIDLITAQMDKDGFVKIGEEFQPGDRVIIKNGPMKNFVGVFERDLKEKERIMILLTTISYQSRVIIEKELVMKVMF